MEVGEKGQELGRCQKKAGVREKKKKKQTERRRADSALLP